MVRKASIPARRLVQSSLLFMLVWIVLQDLVAAFLYREGLPLACVKLLTSAKDIMVVVLTALCLFLMWWHSKTRFKKTDLLAGMYLAVCVGFLPFGSVPTEAKVMALRAITLPALLYTLGRIAFSTTESHARLLRWMKIVGVFVVIFGLVEYFLLPISFWSDFIGIGNYIAQVKGAEGFVYNGLPANFMGDYGSGFASTRRLVGPFGSPLTTGYFLAFFILLLLVELFNPQLQIRKRGNFLLLGLSSLALFLTVSRGAFLAVLVAGVILLFRYRVGGRFMPWLLIAFGGVAAILAVRRLESLIYDGSTVLHILNATHAWVQFATHPFGSGIGTAGAWAAVFGGAEDSTENSYLTVGIQVGVPGLILFLAFWWRAIRRAISVRWDPASPQSYLLAQLALYTTIGFAATGMLSEQLLSFTTIAPFWFLIGAVQSARTQEDLDHG